MVAFGGCPKVRLPQIEPRTRGANSERLASVESGEYPSASGSAPVRLTQNVLNPNTPAPQMSQKFEETNPIAARSSFVRVAQAGRRQGSVCKSLPRPR